MEIEMHEQPRSRLEEFADKHGLVMEIHERKNCQDINKLWYAHFKSAEVQEGGMLKGSYGNGATPELAMAAYSVEISGTKLVIGAYTTDRKEIYVPILTDHFRKLAA